MLERREQATERIPAIIYCRVSSTRQKLEGSGLDSQEHRCRQYADAQGYDVVNVFPDDASGGGDFMQRPGMRKMLAYIDEHPDENFVVIFDDLKRFARDTMFHIMLREAFQQRGASVECLNFRFEDTPEGKFTETMFAAQGELERDQNRRQVLQKMKARVERGYNVFHSPIGYAYGVDPVHGKLLMRAEPVASIIAEALEGFASGRFASQSEVKRFFESFPEFPRSKLTGEVRITKVRDILERVTYAGYVEAPDWGVSLRKGHHKPLISLETHQRIQDRLKGASVVPARKDIRKDFPMRGFVLCDDCGEPMTSCWSKGRKKSYAYYLCDTRDCASKRKSVPRAKIEEGAEAILQTLQPSKGMAAIAKAMLTDLWDKRLSEAKSAQKALQRQLQDVEAQIETTLDRLIEASNASVVRAYETRVEKLEREKLLLSERADTVIPPKGRLDEVIEHAIAFLASPWDIYEKGSFTLKRTVLKLAFVQPLRYNRLEGYRTAETAFPFKVLAETNFKRCGLVEHSGIEPAYCRRLWASPRQGIGIADAREGPLHLGGVALVRGNLAREWWSIAGSNR